MTIVSESVEDSDASGIDTTAIFIYLAIACSALLLCCCVFVGLDRAYKRMTSMSDRDRVNASSMNSLQYPWSIDENDVQVGGGTSVYTEKENFRGSYDDTAREFSISR